MNHINMDIWDESKKIKEWNICNKKKKIKIACIGDSITYGSGVMPTRQKNAYPAKLGTMLGSKYQVLNYGLRGRTLLNEGDKPYRKEELFKASQKALPDIVLIMLGTNDSKSYNWNEAEYEIQLREFLNIYKNLESQPEVYLMTCCAVFAIKGKTQAQYDINKSVIANEMICIVERVGEECDVPVIDIYKVTKEHPEYFVDGIHPKATGNQVIAQTVYNYLISSQK